jgi:hypothetical protein
MTVQGSTVGVVHPVQVSRRYLRWHVWELRICGVESPWVRLAAIFEDQFRPFDILFSIHIAVSCPASRTSWPSHHQLLHNQDSFGISPSKHGEYSRIRP